MHLDIDVNACEVRRDENTKQAAIGNARYVVVEATGSILSRGFHD